MLSQNFIFSERKSDQLPRHLVFWLVWGSYFIVQHIAFPFLRPEASYFNNIPFTITEGFLILIMTVPITYVSLYFILPIYSRDGKLLKALCLFIACWFLHYVLNSLMFFNVNPYILNWVLPEKYLEHTERPPAITSFMNLLAVFVGGISATIFVAGFKFVKQWYLKEQRNIQLRKENAESQLQLLTAQVHPHFLFNTLNNIYSQTQLESPKGSKMIMELSDMLRYILAEGRKTQVPLQKELAMIQDYINLEKIRYGSRLDLHVSIPQQTAPLLIAPLILLPFIETSFNQESSQPDPNPWISFTIEINGRQFTMKLMQGRGPDQLNQLPENSTAIVNVKKRLELLYPGKHDLQVTTEAEVWVVNLKLDLEEDQEAEMIPLASQTTPHYA